MNINYARRPRIVYRCGGFKVTNYKYNDERGVEYQVTDGIHTFSLSQCPILSYDYICKLMQQYKQEIIEKISYNNINENYDKENLD